MSECETCKILTAKPYPVPNVGKLPAIRITAKYPFAVTGIDFVSPFTLKEKKQELKAYMKFSHVLHLGESTLLQPGQWRPQNLLQD